MKVVLAEKPSVARELAAFLGATTRREGYLEGKGYQVTWALGHLVGLKEPQDYDPALKQWSLKTLPIVPDHFELKPLDQRGGREQLAVIRKLLRNADEVIGATDAGREGELILRYILELSGWVGQPATRLWLSSLTREAIRDAFGQLRPLAEYDNLYAAARCRSEADWVVGLNATRFYTVTHRAGGQLWSVGRVQTPVLALIVRRDDEIRGFRPEPFWELSTVYRKVVFRLVGDRFPREEEAQAVLAQVVDQPFTIRGVERKPERVLPPQLYDLTDLQRDMNRRYGMSADDTLRAAQTLYENKLISYPRTDSRFLGNDMKPKIPKILEALRGVKPEAVGGLDLGKLDLSGRIFNSKKVSDHHAIIPTGKPPGGLAGPTAKVFDAVATRLIAAFYPACVKEVTTVHGDAASVKFRARGVRVVEPGWTVLEPRKADPKKAEEAQEMPRFEPGESGPHAPNITRGETSPPKTFTEDSLLGAMETAGKLVDDEALRDALKEKGLGTPATRASIIETLLTRGYIRREGKTVTATDAGRYLIAVIEDRGLTSPELTGEWEARLREVERGALDPHQFMADIVRFAGEVVHPRPPDPPSEPGSMGPCPRCGRPVIAGKKGFGCSGWRDGCPFVLWREWGNQTLSDDQIRELLSRRRIPASASGSPAILHLTDVGQLTEIPVPTGESKFQRSAGSGSGRRPMTKVSERSATKRRTGTKAPRAAKRKTKEDGTAPEAGGETPATKFAPVPFGPCPLCQSEVVEGEKGYGCSGWRNGCKFTIWKTMAGQKISPATARTLLKKGRTGVLKGFSSKTGKTFEARLKIDGGEVRFDFDR